MSEQTITVPPEGPSVLEDELLVREYAAQISEGDGRTVDVRFVPFGERITHNDGFGGVPKGVDYVEEWMPGAFDHQLNAAHRVLANVEHQQGIAGTIGRGQELRSAADGYHATMRILDGSDGDKTLQLIRDGVLDGVSLEAKPVKSIKSRDGVVQRVKANLYAIAFTRFAAYKGAQVLAVRHEPETLLDEDLIPVGLKDEVVERCRRLGIKLPQRYQAHPDETDTPAEAGTSAIGTRHDGTHSDMEESGDADAG